MPLTKEERDRLELQRSEARVKMRKLYPTIVLAKKILKQYQADYTKQSSRFTFADRALAEEDKVTRYTSTGQKVGESEVDGVFLLHKLSKDQLERIMKEVDESED